MWCLFGHVTVDILNHQNTLTPLSGCREFGVKVEGVGATLNPAGCGRQRRQG